MRVCECVCVCVLHLDVSLCGSRGMKASDWGDPSSDADCNCACLLESGREVVAGSVSPLRNRFPWPLTLYCSGSVRSLVAGSHVPKRPIVLWLLSRDLLACLSINPLILTVIPFQNLINEMKLKGVLFPSPTLKPNLVWHFHVQHDFHQFAVHRFISEQQTACCVCALLFGRLTHPR